MPDPKTYWMAGSIFMHPDTLKEFKRMVDEVNARETQIRSENPFAWGYRP